MISDRAFPLTSIRLADAEEIVTWLSSRAEVTLFGGPGLPYPLTAEGLLATASDQWWVFVLPWDGRPLATGSLGTRDQGVARIGRVLVDPRRRGEGWGRLVMEALIARAGELPGVTAVELGVYEQNQAARALYESLGFRDSGIRAQTEVDGAVWTSLQLTRPIP